MNADSLAVGPEDHPLPPHPNFAFRRSFSKMHTMCAIASQISARDVLNIFRGDAPYLFLGAAFVAVGLVSAAFAAIRRKRDSLLIYFALFAVFYGVRILL